jgi:hypothetical protein
MSDADVTDVVAWLAAQRQPLSAKLNHPGGSECATFEVDPFVKTISCLQ